MSSTTSNQHDASKISAIKDQAVGTVKQVIGTVLGNNKMEVDGKAQKLQGKNEFQEAKAAQNETAPNPQAYDPQTYHQQNFNNPTNLETHVPSALQGPPSAPIQQHNMEPNVQYSVQLAPNQQNIVPPAPEQPTTFSNENKPSQMSAWKDQAVGSIKENIGSTTNNTQMELAGKAQSIHGHNETEFAKAQKEGHNEPHHFEHGTKTTEHAQGEVEDDKVSTLSAMKDQAMGSVKQTLGSATGNMNTELEGKAQQLHGKNEAEFAKAQKQGLNEPEHYAKGTKTTEHAQGEVEDQSASTIGALKDKAMGSIKETFGSMTGNQNMELQGKAQNMHGRNEAEFVKAQNQGLAEPEHFTKGKKTTEHAQGEVEDDKVSTLSAMKDQAMGSVKQTLGSATGNMNTELEGKAQQLHGKNEAEFAKAQKQGLNEPEHYAKGTKTTEYAEAKVVGEEPSKISGWKDQKIGAVKESVGSAINKQEMEIEGKAQKMQGRNECAAVEARNIPTNA